LKIIENSKYENLILIRHAKSNWDAPLQDIDRPLDQRGMKDAHLVSSSILDFIPKTYVIWSSIAKEHPIPLLFLPKIFISY
jgi:broad specificity phosphatase PhoE